jgi:pyrroline-5-carboxylate reductase
MTAPATPILVAGARRMGGALISGWTRAFAPRDLIVRDPSPGAAALAAREIAPHLRHNVVIVSILAGVGADALAGAFGGRAVALAMPDTAAAVGKGATGLYAKDDETRKRAHGLFEPVGAVVDLDGEALMHVATAASASAPAYLYAFIEALQDAAVAAGLSPGEARRLAAGAVTGAAALLDETGDDPAELRRQDTSTGGLPRRRWTCS